MKAVNEAPLTLLHPTERAYVSTLKRRERAELAELISRKHARAAPLRIQVLRSRLPESVKLEMFETLTRPACDKYVTWATRAIQLPLGVQHFRRNGSRSPRVAVECALEEMNACVTGHDGAKREVLKVLGQLQSNASRRGHAFGFEGPPGTGKTHFAKHCLARVLDLPIVFIPLGGATDVSYLLGSLYVYEGSKHGRLASALIESGCSDPILFFDELDKVSTTERGAEIVNVLIHLIDATTNAEVRDRYFHGIDIDFSRCTFCFSYNDASHVSPILLDRIQRIEMPVPSTAEKYEIVKRHFVPRVQKALGVDVTLAEETIAAIVARSQGGMRDVERDVHRIMDAAHLSQCCYDPSGSVAGARVLSVVAHGVVTHDFAMQVLARVKESSKTPPSMMYS